MCIARRAPLAAALLLAFSFLPLVAAQEPPAPEKPAAQPEKPAADADSPAAAKAAAKPGEKPFREQTIYIPYTKLREVFNKKGRGVFLPYEEFQALWQAARDKQAAPPEPKSPVGVLISEVENEATVGKDTVRVAAKLKLEVLAEGWQELALRLADAAILSAELAGQPARIVPDGQHGYKLLVEKTGKQAEQLELKLEYAKAFAKSPGQNSVSFQAPQAPVNRWKVRIPEAGVKVDVHPLIAASEVPAGEAKPNETTVLAFVGAASEVRVDWTPKAEGASGLTALATVQAQHDATIDEGVIRTSSVLAYEISRAEMSQLVIEVPADQKVVNVFDPNVRQWEVKTAGALQQITVQLFEPTRGNQKVTVELEKFSGDAAKQEVTVPVVKAVGAGRQQGLVVVRLGTGLRAETARRTGLLQVDAGELPAALAKQGWTFAYRYSALPFDLALSVEKVLPRIRVDELVEIYLEPEKLSVDLMVVYHIEQAGVFQWELDVPAGYDVRQVQGRERPGAQAAQVDAWHLEGDNKTRLVVNLSRKATGDVALLVQLEKRLSDPNLLSPTGKASDIPLPLPRVAPTGIEQVAGRVVMYAPEGLRINPGQTTGLRSISFAEAYQGTESCRGERFASLRPVLAYAYSRDPASANIAAERRKPQITVRQFLLARVDAGVAKYEATFFYDILYSGVKSLRIDIPKSLAPEVRNQTPGVREKTLDPPPADVAEDAVAWSLSGETEFLGSATIKLAWETKIEKLDLGKSVDLTIPVLKPRDVDRAWGQVALAKAETIDVQATGDPRGLRPIDPQRDLMPGATVADAARAFEFQEDWQLAVAATQYKLEEVKRTSIERAVVRIVATRSEELAVQALYRMRSALQRLAITLPANARFDTQPVSINGRSVTLERGDKDELFVPLVGQSAETQFLLEVRYTTPGNASQLDLPAFPDEPAVQKVYLCVHLPEELAWLGYRGPWSDEQTWRPAGGSPFDHQPQPRENENQLIAWVTEGIANKPTDMLQTDGRLYVFSALHPAPPPDGSLHLTTIKETWLHMLVFAVVALVGLALTGLPGAQRLLAVAGFISLLIMLGVFLPTFSAQVLDGVLWSAVALVLLAWTGAFAATLLGKRPLFRPAAMTTGAGAAAVGPPVESPFAPPPSPAPPAESPPEPEPPKPDDASHGGPNHG